MLPLQLSSASPGPLQDEGWEHAGPAGDAGRKHWYRKGGPPAEAEHAGCTCRAACPARSSSTSWRRTHFRRPKRMTPAGRSILATRLPPTTRSDRCFSACEQGASTQGARTRHMRRERWHARYLHLAGQRGPPPNSSRPSLTCSVSKPGGVQGEHAPRVLKIQQGCSGKQASPVASPRRRSGRASEPGGAG